MADLANDLRDGAMTEFGLYAKAATAAAYEVAAEIVCERHRIHMTAKGRNPDDYVSDWSFTADAIRALATPDQTAALDRLIAEAEARAVENISELVRGWRNTIPMTGEECADAILAASKKVGQ